MMRTLRILTLILITGTILLFNLNEKVYSKELLPITIGWQPDPNAAIFIAMQKGYFEAVGLKPTFVKFLAGPPMFAALQSKSIDLTDFGLCPAVIAASQGIDFKCIAVPVDTSGVNVLVVRSDSGINKLADIKGKKIASVRGSTPYYGLVKALESINFSLKDINFLDMPAPNHIPAFKRGDIDGSFVWPPWQNKMVRLDGKRITSNAAVGALSPEVWAARTEWIREKPQVVRLFLTAMEMAMKDVRRDPKAAAKALTDAMELESEIGEEIVNECYYPLAEEHLSGERYILSLDKGLIDAFRKGAEFLYSQNIIKVLPKAENFIDAGPMRAYLQSGK